MPRRPDAAARRLWLSGLGALFGVEFVLAGLRPYDRGDWLLENALVVPFVALLFWRGWERPLTRGAYALIFAFLALHEIGSHYTYSLVPYARWAKALGLELASAADGARNHFDRAVHLAFGLLMAHPLRELLARRVAARSGVLTALTGLVMLSLSGVYELIEWLAAESVDPQLGIAYVGAQGDVWDAQKDTALAWAGTWLSLGAGTLLRARTRRARLWHVKCTDGTSQLEER